MVLHPITPVLNSIQNKLWDLIVQRVSYVSGAGRNVEEMIFSVSMLKDVRMDIMERVKAAESQLLIRTHEVDGWLMRVEELEEEVKAIEQQFLSRCKCLCFCHLNICSNYRIGKQAARKTSEIKKMLHRTDFYSVATRPYPEAGVELPTSTSTVGIESLLEEVTRCLLDEVPQIVAICGMGGVGKTTLLRKINNMFLDRESDEFDFVIMVEASSGFHQIEQLQQQIAQRIGLSSSEDADIQCRANQIFNCLRNNKFLLLLDNLWQPIDLTIAGIPTEQHKCKVVIATRDESICGTMGVSTKIKVECLSPEKAWELFRQRLGHLVDDPEIESLAKLVAEECRGLPLALVAVAAAMSAKKTREEWQFAADMMKEMRLDQLISEEPSLFSILMLSYDSLSNDQLKLCFLSCSSYPAGHSISKQELIECWMGLGFLTDHDNIERDYMEGHFLIGKLQESSLLESGNDEEHVTMHNVIRGLALHITHIGLAPQMADLSSFKRWVVRAREGLTKIPNQYLQGSSIERMSLMNNNINLLPEKTHLPSLLSLMLQCNQLRGIIPQDFFGGMRCLKYLDLSYTSVTEVNGIDQLVFLEYLNLAGTSIHELPSELLLLTNLKYLYLMHTNSLRMIPYKLLLRLSNLRVFNAYRSSYKSWVTDDSAGGESSEANGASFYELEELIYLKALGISIETHATLEKIFSSAIPTRYLYISLDYENINIFKFQLPLTIHGRSKFDTSLLELTIESCQDLEELMIGEEEKTMLGNISRGHRICFLKALQNLYLQSLDKLSRIIWKGVTPSEYFPGLRLLSIVGCQKLNHVTWVLQLPHLVKLHISDCSGMQQVIANHNESIVEEGNASYFPMLTAMNLINLPELTNICQHTLDFPYLESLHVSGCSNLTSLPFGGQRYSRLREIRGNREWWNNLNWASDDINKSFSEYFQEAAS